MRTLLCALAVSAMVSFTRADEESIPLDKLPKAVVEAVKKRFPKAEMTEAAKETDKDKTVYEVTLKQDKKNIDVTVTPEGAIKTIEMEIDAKEFPKPVADAITAKYPKATIKMAEQVISVKDGKETTDFFEAVVVTADKKTFELEILADGTIKNTEEKTEEKKDKK